MLIKNAATHISRQSLQYTVDAKNLEVIKGWDKPRKLCSDDIEERRQMIYVRFSRILTFVFLWVDSVWGGMSSRQMVFYS